MTTTLMTPATVTDIQEGLQIRALQFIKQTMEARGVLPRRQLIQATLEHLQDHHTLSDGTAEKIACKALCEWESIEFNQYVDLNESTAYCIAVKDPKLGVTRFFSMLDIRNMLATAKLITLPTPSVVKAKAAPSLPMWPRGQGEQSLYNQ